MGRRIWFAGGGERRDHLGEGEPPGHVRRREPRVIGVGDGGGEARPRKKDQRKEE